MSTIDKQQSDLSNLPEQEQLIFLFYNCEVSSHPFVQHDKIGGSTHYKIIKSLANQHPSIRFDMTRPSFNRKAKEIMKMAEAAKQLRSGGKVSLSATMKKKNEAIAKLGGKAEAILDSPPAPHLYSQWVHSEYVPGTQKTKSVVVTMHRFLMFSMVTIGSFKKEWETARRLRIEVAFPAYFTNGLVTSATLVDSKGMKLMEGDHAAISAGFERSAKEQTEPGKKQPHSTFYITYEEDQDTKEFFDIGEGHRGFYLQPGKARRADGKICDFEELCVVTKEYFEEEEDPDADEIIERAHEAAIFDPQSMWGGANANANSNHAPANNANGSQNSNNNFHHNNVQQPTSTHTARTATTTNTSFAPPPQANHTVQQPTHTTKTATTTNTSFAPQPQANHNVQQPRYTAKTATNNNVSFVPQPNAGVQHPTSAASDMEKMMQAITMQMAQMQANLTAQMQQQEQRVQQQVQQVNQHVQQQVNQQVQQQVNQVNLGLQQQVQTTERSIANYLQENQTRVDARVDTLSDVVAKKPASRPQQKRLAADSAQLSVTSKSKRARQSIVSGGDEDDDSLFSDTSQNFVPTVPDNIQVQTVATIQT